MRPATRCSVLLATEDTYPHVRRGVSTWCDALIRKLADFDFHLVAVTRMPSLAAEHSLNPNIREVIAVPLFGWRDAAEYGGHTSFADYLQRRRSTSEPDIEERFVPQYRQLISEIVHPLVPPRALGLVLLRMHLQLQHVDYHRTLTHAAVWEVFNRTVGDGWRAAFPDEPMPSAEDLRDGWRMLYRLLLPLAVDVPRVDVAHATSAGVCGLPCVMARLRWGVPFVLTEHDAHVREHYLDAQYAGMTAFCRWFLSRAIGTLADVSYAFADQVSPICEHVARWARWRHVDDSRIQIVHTGADPEKFAPSPRPSTGRPTVVNVGRLSASHAQLDLIEAAALVRREIPDVIFRLYGSREDGDYARACEARVNDLGLADHVAIAGYTDAPWTVLQNTDVAAFTGQGGGFPLAVIEAMLTESAIVATDEGGLAEALGDAGVLVAPRDCTALADAIVSLLRSPEQRGQLGRRARERARRFFTEDRFCDAYRETYARLVGVPAGALDLQNVAIA